MILSFKLHYMQFLHSALLSRVLDSHSLPVIDVPLDSRANGSAMSFIEYKPQSKYSFYDRAQTL